jgi:hypothetical protein
MREHPSAVLPHQRRDDVHVVVGVPDRDPPDHVVVAALGQAQPVDVVRGDVGPLGVGQRPVVRGGADRQVVGRLGVLVDPTNPDRRVQQSRQTGDIRPAVRPTPRLEGARRLPAGDDPGVDMCRVQATLAGQALGEQVAQQPAGVGASPAHLPDHQLPALAFVGAAHCSGQPAGQHDAGPVHPLAGPGATADGLQQPHRRTRAAVHAATARFRFTP